MIPCYNAEPHVRRAVASALAQTLLPDVIVCVDDGSKDGTLRVLRDLEAEHAGKVRVLAGPNRGAGVARNRGLAEATGTYVQFLDADDELDPGKLEAQVWLAKHENADLVVGADRYVSREGSVRTRVPASGNPWLHLMAGNLGNTVSNLWRRSAVESIGGWSEGLKSSQESDLMSRLLQNGATVAVDPEPRATVYWSPGSISATDVVNKKDRYLNVRAELLAEGERRGALAGGELDAAREAFFVAVRNYYGQNPEGALGHYRRSLPPRYVPGASPSNTRPYVWLCRLLGFERAERVRRWARSR